MRVIGIILEVNPLHLGHKYFIQKIIEEYHPDVLIGITSTYFTMRGDLNCWTKKQKVSALLDLGIDLVFELPFELALQRADLFAKYSIEILKALNITDLAFGIEKEGQVLLKQVQNYLETPEFNNDFKTNLHNNLSYKKAYLRSLAEKFNSNDIEKIAKSNFTLGIEYLNYLKDTSIEPIIIDRQGADYQEALLTKNYPSATAIRLALRENNPQVKNYLAFPNLTYLDLNKLENNLLILSEYLLKVLGLRLADDLEGIGNYICKNGDFTTSYQNFITSLANQKYSQTRIKRYLIKLIIFQNQEFPLNYALKEPYLRLLGLSKRGMNYLNTRSNNLKKQIFSSPNDSITSELKAILSNELKLAKLFDTLNKTNLLIEEYQFPIKKKGE